MKEKFKKLFSIENRFKLKNWQEKLKKPTIKLNKNEKKIMFLDAASYNNLGDQAIAYAMSEFLKNEFKDYKYIEVSDNEIVRNIKYIRKNTNSKDIICLTGGGNMGTIYPRYEAIRRMIIKNFPNNKIVIFPQTIDYENNKYGKKEFEKSKKIYNKHRKLLICARENRSYKIMKEAYNNVILVPDIVLYLIGRIRLNIEKNDKTGICLRGDKESILSQNIINAIRKIPDKKNITTLSNEKYINKDVRKKKIYNKLKEFGECKYVITDRLHGMIFSSIVNVPCIAIDNSNKKISGVYNMARDNLKNVILYKKCENIEKTIQQIKNKKIKSEEVDFKELIINIRKE